MVNAYRFYDLKATPGGKFVTNYFYQLEKFEIVASSDYMTPLYDLTHRRLRTNLHRWPQAGLSRFVWNLFGSNQNILVYKAIETLQRLSSESVGNSGCLENYCGENCSQERN